jgi:hypothetical protein
VPDDTEEEFDGDEDQETRLSVKDLRALRKAVKERDELQTRLSTQERELSFAKANLDLNDPKMKYFIKSYEGDLTPEAIRAQAEADGFLQASQTQESKPDLSGQTRIANASSGAGETVVPGLEDRIRNAKNSEEVMAIMIEAGRPTSWNRPTDR